MQNGTEQPYLLLDGVTPGRWAKGFTCQEGLVCRVSDMAGGGGVLIIGCTWIYTVLGNRESFWRHPQL